MFINNGYWTLSPANLKLINIGWNSKKVPCDIYVDEAGKKYRNYEQGFKGSDMLSNPFSRYLK